MDKNETQAVPTTDVLIDEAAKGILEIYREAFEELAK